MPTNPDAAPKKNDSTPQREAGSVTVSERFSELGERFERIGAVGLLVIAAPMLAEVERRHGDEARQHCLASLRERGGRDRRGTTADGFRRLSRRAGM